MKTLLPGLLLVPVAALALIAAGAQAPPSAAERRPFAEGIVSTPDDELGGALSPDGKVFLYTKSIPRSQMYVICETRRLSNGWGRPRIVSFSGRWRDADPVFSLDGRRVYFVSDRPVGGVDRKNYDLWYAERRGDEWGEPVHLEAPINSDANEFFASFAADGTIYFTSRRAGGLGDIDVYRSRWVDGKYTAPENLGPTINGKGWLNIEAFIAPDQSFLLVGAFGHTDDGDSDILVSYRDGASFGPLKLLGPAVNTSVRDYSPRISPDGKTLFFTSERGLGSEPRTPPWTYHALQERRLGILNGLGNIYAIPLAEALAGTR